MTHRKGLGKKGDATAGIAQYSAWLVEENAVGDKRFSWSVKLGPLTPVQLKVAS